MQAQSSAGRRSKQQGGRWAVLLLLLAANMACAQFGPLDTNGFVEYRYSLFGGDMPTRNTHGAILRTDLSTFFWRPWVLSINANIAVEQRKADSQDFAEDGTILNGGLKLNFLSRSKYPLLLYYDNFDGRTETDSSSRKGQTELYGLMQQFSSRRLGTYSLEWRNESTDLLYLDGVRIPERRQSERWQFQGRKTIGRNTFALISRNLEIDSQVPQRFTESLRHSLRHSYRTVSGLDIRNSAFISDERIETDMLETDRSYRQMSSVLTWRPKSSRRLLISGRGYLQDSTFRDFNAAWGLRSLSLSGSVNYQYSDNLTFTGGLGYLEAKNGDDSEYDSGYQQLGVNFRSSPYPLWGGAYRYTGQVSVANRTNPMNLGVDKSQDLGTGLGHSYTRSLGRDSGSRWTLKLSQRATTRHDTLGRERNSLFHDVSLTNSKNSANVSRYFRISLLDQHWFADERRDSQLVSLQYSLQGQVSRDRAWGANASFQYGRRKNVQPVESALQSDSISYSVALNYRHADLFDLRNLVFTSDLRLQSEDFQTEDPFDPDFIDDQQRVYSTWRNRFDYRIGLLQLIADANIRKIDGQLSTSVYLQIRRYFGMT